MSSYYLAHLNVVRPVGGFSATHPSAVYFFTQLPKVFAAARLDDDMYWHNHHARMPDGSYLDFGRVAEFTSTRTEENFHLLTMAGWRDVKAMHRFAYREELHRQGMKQLHDWVDRSEGPTMVLWWARRGSRIGPDEAWAKITQLRAEGPSPQAFTLQKRYAPPGTEEDQ